MAVGAYISAVDAAREDDPIPSYLLARLYEKMNREADAIVRYQKTISLPKAPPDAYFSLARIFIKKFDTVVVEDLLKKADPNKKHKDQVEYLKTKLRDGLGEKNLAEAMYKKILSTRSRIPEIYVDVADKEMDKNNFDLAEFFYAMALRYDPVSSQGLYGVASARFYIDSPTRAIEFLQAKLTIYPNSAPILNSMALLYLKLKNTQLAKEYLSKAARADARYVSALKALGDVARKEGFEKMQSNPAEAEVSFKHAIAAYELYNNVIPDDPQLYFSLGDLYFDLHDYGAAAKNFEKVKTLAPSYPGVRLRLAKISMNGGDAKRAIDLINEEVKTNPNNAEAFVMLGDAKFFAKEYQMAIKQYTTAIRLSEKNVNAMLGLGRVYFIQGHHDLTQGLYERASKLDPANGEIRLALAKLYAKLSQKNKAVTAINDFDALVKNPSAKEVEERNKIIESLKRQ